MITQMGFGRTDDQILTPLQINKESYYREATSAVEVHRDKHHPRIAIAITQPTYVNKDELRKKIHISDLNARNDQCDAQRTHCNFHRIRHVTWCRVSLRHIIGLIVSSTIKNRPQGPVQIVDRELIAYARLRRTAPIPHRAMPTRARLVGSGTSLAPISMECVKMKSPASRK